MNDEELTSLNALAETLFANDDVTVRQPYLLKKFNRADGEYEEDEEEPETQEGYTEEEEALFRNVDVQYFRYKKLAKLFVRTFPDTSDMSITISHSENSITFNETGKAPIGVSIL